MKKKESEEEEEEHIIRFESKVPLPPIPNTNYAAFILNIYAQHGEKKAVISYAPIVPHMARYLLHSPLVQEYDLSSLMSLVCGSAPLPATTQETFMKKVAPSELEAVLLEVEGVEEVAVVGVPSLQLGEAPRAYVVLTPGVTAPSPKALLEYVAARVVPYKRLEGGVEFVESLPKNAMLKVLKRQLRDDFTKKAAGTASATVPNSKL